MNVTRIGEKILLPFQPVDGAYCRILTGVYEQLKENTIKLRLVNSSAQYINHNNARVSIHTHWACGWNTKRKRWMAVSYQVNANTGVPIKQEYQTSSYMFASERDLTRWAEYQQENFGWTRKT